MSSSKGLLLFKRISVLLFVVAVIVLLAFNVTSTIQLGTEQNKRDALNASLETEKEHARELALLELKHKRLETEFRMMEFGLRKQYENECNSLDEFIPVFDDRIVAHAIQSGGFRDGRIDTVFSVPKNGRHRLKIRARKGLLWPAKYDSGEDVFNEVYPLESGKHRIGLFKGVANGKVRMILDDKKIQFDSSFESVKNSTLIRMSLIDRTVMVPNQLMPHGATQSTGVICQSFLTANARIIGMNQVLLVEFAIESDGPVTSLPDDPFVVSEILKKFNAGTPLKFTYNPEGWYEFEE